MNSSPNEDCILQRTSEHIFDVPVPQMCEDAIELFKIVSQDKIQQCVPDLQVKTPFSANRCAVFFVRVPQ